MPKKAAAGWRPLRTVQPASVAGPLEGGTCGFLPRLRLWALQPCRGLLTGRGIVPVGRRVRLADAEQLARPTGAGKPPGALSRRKGGKEKEETEGASPLTPFQGERGYGGERRKAYLAWGSRVSYLKRFYRLPTGYLKKLPNPSRAAFLTRWRFSARHEKKGISGARNAPAAV